MLKLQVAAIDQPKPNCPKTCGNLNITFPFGTSSDCYLDENFLITCKGTHYNRPQPFLRTGNMEVLNLTLGDGQIKVSSSVAKRCYDATGKPIIYKKPWIELKAYTISPTGNNFTVVGCDTTAYIRGFNDDYTVGCISLCNELESIKKGSCSGIGCCQTSIPDGIKNLTIDLRTSLNYTKVNKFNSCGYAFVSEVGYLNDFSPDDLKDLRNRTRVPMVLDYAIGNLSCTEDLKIEPGYACRSENADCANSTTGQGYFCKCLNGYEGNPYLNGEDGCKEINECDALKPCKGKCKDLVADYYCYCPEGQRKLLKLREKFFLKNGGSLLLEKLSAQKGCTTRATIFTEEDLKKATNNFSEATIIGKGGFGTVHKGVLSDNRIVAIKKSKVTESSQTEQFINEVIVLSQINHRHVVNLLGCCLETEVPLLVYEFIPNGTLHTHIHDEYLSPIFTWDMRLKVATEAADALAYLHSAASVPVIHRDVKSANILLDKYCNEKVADFGASRFIPIDETEVTTLVQGTFGYLDPEYFHSSQLTDKSDVYSFGVVLAELLTGQEAVSFNKSEKERNLAMYFVSSVNDDKLLEILDHRVVVGEGNAEQVAEVGLLAKRCLNVKGDERPTMKEVARELERLKVVQQHPWTKNDLKYPEEIEYLLNHNVSSAAYDSMNDQIIVHLNDTR
ncbi:hypothetical protein ACH5RR_036566 [Cinchona calisaya]|uniref:Protein kinase domain-containing protein n=1 Tax=Cinchona calisaya TaxID=153742 RepID=A0ABD2Y6R5_9GENT